MCCTRQGERKEKKTLKTSATSAITRNRPATFGSGASGTAFFKSLTSPPSPSGVQLISRPLPNAEVHEKKNGTPQKMIPLFTPQTIPLWSIAKVQIRGQRGGSQERQRRDLLQHLAYYERHRNGYDLDPPKVFVEYIFTAYARSLPSSSESIPVTVPTGIPSA